MQSEVSPPFSSHDVVLRLGTDRALHTVTDPTTQLLINGILNIYNFIIAIVAGLLCDKVGRRPLFIASTVGEPSSSELGHLSGTADRMRCGRHVCVLGAADCVLCAVLGDRQHRRGAYFHRYDL